MLLFFFSFILIIPIYIVGGIAVNKVRKGATGIEMFPNIAFWRDFPGLVKVSLKLYIIINNL